MYGYTATHHPRGIGTAAVGSVLAGSFPAPDPFIIHQYTNDFDTFDSATGGDWTVTGTGTNALVAGDGGLLASVNSAALNDVTCISLKVATFALVAGNEAWMKVRFKVSSAANTAAIIGLTNLTTNPFGTAPTDGLYFSTVASQPTLTLKSANTSVTTTATPVATLADNTFLNVGFHYDGVSTVAYYVNNNRIGSFAPNLTTANLALTFAEQNGTAAAVTTTIDYVTVATQRPSTAL